MRDDGDLPPARRSSPVDKIDGVYPGVNDF